MKTLKLTKTDFLRNGTYIGKTDVSDFDGNIEIESNLQTIYFPGSMYINGYLHAGLGTGICVQHELDVKGSISVGLSVIAPKGIHSGGSIYTAVSIITNGGLLALGDIIAIGVIEAGFISAAESVISGCDIIAKEEISIGKNRFIVAGINSLNDEEHEIRCTKLKGGEVKLGKLVLVQPKPETKQVSSITTNHNGKTVEIDGKRYKLVFVEQNKHGQ